MHAYAYACTNRYSAHFRSGGFMSSGGGGRRCSPLFLFSPRSFMYLSVHPSRTHRYTFHAHITTVLRMRFPHSASEPCVQHAGTHLNLDNLNVHIFPSRRSATCPWTPTAVPLAHSSPHRAKPSETKELRDAAVATLTNISWPQRSEVRASVRTVTKTISNLECEDHRPRFMKDKTRQRQSKGESENVLKSNHCPGSG